GGGERGSTGVGWGVQAWEGGVGVAVNGVRGGECTLAVSGGARRSGFRSVNDDLMYGLPKQTARTLERTLARVVGANPDRIALYNYAHLPALIRAQRQIREEDLPSADARLQLFGLALKRLVE